jgi:hypothetical protein
MKQGAPQIGVGQKAGDSFPKSEPCCKRVVDSVCRHLVIGLPSATAKTVAGNRQGSAFSGIPPDSCERSFGTGRERSGSDSSRFRRNFRVFVTTTVCSVGARSRHREQSGRTRAGEKRLEARCRRVRPCIRNSGRSIRLCARKMYRSPSAMARCTPTRGASIARTDIVCCAIRRWCRGRAAQVVGASAGDSQQQVLAVRRVAHAHSLTVADADCAGP